MKQRAMRSKYHRCLGLAILLAVLGVFSACGASAGDGGEGAISVYYLNHKGTGLTTVSYHLKSEEAEARVTELLEQLSSQPEDVDYVAPISGDIGMVTGSLSDGIVTVDFDGEYRLLSVANEVLLRAAVVKTLVQLEDVEGVAFSVASQPLTNTNGTEVGVMNDESFLFDYGRAQSQAEEGVLVLYYATEDGNHLSAIERRVHYSNVIPMEQVVMNYLAEPPERDGLMSAIPEGTKVLSVVINETTCYVTLDSSFLNFPEGELREVAIYSIVDSLCELDAVTKVQIIINNEAELVPVESDRVSGTYEKNVEFVL